MHPSVQLTRSCSPSDTIGSVALCILRSCKESRTDAAPLLLPLLSCPLGSAKLALLGAGRQQRQRSTAAASTRWRHAGTAHVLAAVQCIVQRVSTPAYS